MVWALGTEHLDSGGDRVVTESNCTGVDEDGRVRGRAVADVCADTDASESGSDEESRCGQHGGREMVSTNRSGEEREGRPLLMYEVHFAGAFRANLCRYYGLRIGRNERRIIHGRYGGRVAGVILVYAKTDRPGAFMGDAASGSDACTKVWDRRRTCRAGSRLIVRTAVFCLVLFCCVGLFGSGTFCGGYLGSPPDARG